MNRLLLSLLFISLTSSAQTFEGNYLGELQVPGGKLRLGLVVRSAPAGGYEADLVSIDQGNTKIPASTISLEGRTVKFAAAAFRASFEGRLSEDGNTIAGKFTQGVEIDLTLNRVAALPSLDRPQNPKPPFGYTVEEVAFEGGAEGVQLAGTISFPEGAANLPAIVLVSGSGPQNRDEEVAGHKPFLVWAHRLTKAGFVVLRYDDRGTAKSTGVYRGATTADFALDAKAAVQYIRTRKEVDAAKVIVMGHSEGGIIAPILAAEDNQLAAIVLLAGPAVTGEAILRRQIPDLIKAAGAPESMVAGQIAAIEQQAQTDPWMKSFWAYDPAPVLRKVKCPVLALNGELDLQVNADVNLAAIETSLKAAGNRNFTTRKLPRLNHLFQTAQTGSGREYSTLQETVSPSAMDEVVAWLNQTITRK